MQMIILFPEYRKLGYVYKPVFNLNDNSIKKMAVLIGPILLGTAIAQVSGTVTRMLTSFIGVGALTIMSYATKLILMIYGIVSMAVTTTAYANFARLMANDDYDGFRNNLTKVINFMILLLLPITAGVVILRQPLIDIVYKHGNFGQEAAEATANVLLFLSPIMISYSIREVLCKAYYAMNNTRTPMVISSIGVLINIILTILLVKPYGMFGLAAAISVSAIFTAVAMLIIFNQIIKLNLSYTAVVFVKSLIATIGMILILLFIHGRIYSYTSSQLLMLFVSAIIGIISYALFIYGLRVKEVNEIFNKIRLILAAKLR